MNDLTTLGKKIKKINTTRRVAVSFVCVIIIGSILLTMPFANKLEIRPYIDNLFIATSATCVTGLTPVTIVDQYNLFGQLVILLMIQIGGLGFLTFLYIFIVRIGKTMTLKSKMILQEAINQSSFSKLPTLLKTIMFYTFLVELIGAVILSFAFVPDFGLVKGIYYGIFHSISAFCNAGFDLLGSTSLTAYYNNTLVNLTIGILIILGGLGFVVYRDLVDKFRTEMHSHHSFSKKHYIKTLSLHTKIVLSMTILLIISGMIIFYILEYNNPQTIANMGFTNQLKASFFQSVTLRTAGFATVDMFSLRDCTKMVMCLYMFIGGSPASTAGGIKTVTFALVCLLIHNIARGKEEVVVWGRRIKKRIILRAFTIFALGLTIAFIGCFILVSTQNLSFVNLVFEAFSAFGTVGLSASVTPSLSVIGKIIIIILMYIGRIGPVSMMISFTRKSFVETKVQITYPDEDVLVG